MQTRWRVIVGAWIVLAPEASAQILSSTTKNLNDVDCGGLKLVAASGVPGGQTRGYKLHGTCKILRLHATTSDVAGFSYDKTTNSTVLATVWADLVASWDSKTASFKETMKTQDQYAGQVSMELRCADDPVLTGVTCKGVTYANTTGWDGFDHAYAVPRPISRGKTTLAEATTLSQQQTASTPPSPPPDPTPQPATIRRLSLPRGTEPIAPAPTAPIPVARTRSALTPAPAPPPPPAGPTEIALAPGARVELQDGRAMVAQAKDRALRWAIVGPKEEVLRLFPAGSRLLESSNRDLTVSWGGGAYQAGHRRPLRDALRALPAVQGRRLDTRATQSADWQSANVTPAPAPRAQPTTSRERVDLLQRVFENQRLNESALAAPVRLTPSQPNKVDRLFANLRSGTAITGPASDEAWVLTPTVAAGSIPGGWGGMRLFSGETPLTELFGSPRLTLTIRRAALKSKALVECGVTAQGDGQLSLGGTIAAQTIALKNGGQHLNVVVELPATAGADAELVLEPKSPVAVNYCEISALK
jgi:hypothetical protein